MKKVLLFILLSAVAILLVACGNGEKKPSWQLGTSSSKYYLNLYYDYDSDLGVTFFRPGEYRFESKTNNIYCSYGVDYKIIEGTFDSTGYSKTNINGKDFYYKEDIKLNKLSELEFYRYDSGDDIEDGEHGVYTAKNDDNVWNYVYVYNDDVYVDIKVSLGTIYREVDGNFYSIKDADNFDVSKILLTDDVYNRIFEIDVVEEAYKDR
ncbi:MAG: hypothetical protein IKI57_06650 [Clostridia bacterium]|nr:hypothetical protein [Clostridia bacterium]